MVSWYLSYSIFINSVSFYLSQSVHINLCITVYSYLSLYLSLFLSIISNQIIFIYHCKKKTEKEKEESLISFSSHISVNCLPCQRWFISIYLRIKVELSNYKSDDCTFTWFRLVGNKDSLYNSPETISIKQLTQPCTYNVCHRK